MEPTGAKVKRTLIFTADLDESGEIVQPRLKVEQAVLDLLGALWSVGGIVRIVADRVRMGELPPDGQGRREPLAETLGVFIEYQANTPLNDESITAAMLEAAYGAVSDIEPPGLAAELAARAASEDRTPAARAADDAAARHAAMRDEDEAAARERSDDEPEDDDEPGDEPEIKED